MLRWPLTNVLDEQACYEEWRGYGWLAASGRVHQTVNHTPGQWTQW